SAPGLTTTTASSECDPARERLSCMAERAMLEQTRRCRAAGECVVAVFLTGLALFGLLVISLIASLVLRTPAERSARLETRRFWLTLTISAGGLRARGPLC